MHDFVEALEVAVDRALREGRHEMSEDLCTASDPRVDACVYVGEGVPPLEHDYRTYTQTLRAGMPLRTYLRCVMCHVVSCGSADETDPCIEPSQHTTPHRTRLGLRWPKGESRPKLSALGAS